MAAFAEPLPKKFAFKWPDEMTLNFIRFRSENDHLFTGHRNASTGGYDEIIKMMDLEKVTPQHCQKKWENLKKKYTDLSLPQTGSGTDQGDLTAATWIFYAAMHEAIGQRPSVRPGSLYSSGPSSVGMSPSHEKKNGTASVGAESSEVCSPESSPGVTLKKSAKRRKSDGSAAQAVREWCENMEKSQKEDFYDRAWLSHYQRKNG